MHLIDLLNTDRVHCDVRAGSKKRALELASEQLARQQDDVGQHEIMEGLCAREKLGSTALGHGVAIPHTRLAGLSQPVGVLMRLTDSVDFDAADREPVDLLFALVVPESASEEHLQLLAQIADLFSNRDRRESVRKAGNAKSVYKLIANWQTEPHDA